MSRNARSRRWKRRHHYNFVTPKRLFSTWPRFAPKNHPWANKTAAEVQAIMREQIETVRRDLSLGYERTAT